MKVLTIWLIFVAKAWCKLSPVLNDDHAQYNHLLSPLVDHFKNTKLPVIFWLDKTVYEVNRPSSHLDTLNAILAAHNNWMNMVVRNATQCFRLIRLQNVIITHTYSSMKQLISSLDYDCFYPTGHYIFTVTGQRWQMGDVKSVFETVWKKRILNVVFIVSTNGSMYQAYGYEPYEHGNCGNVRLKLLDQYRDNRWQRLGGWFRRTLPNFHRCPLKAATFESKPFVMLRGNGNQSRYVGLEVIIFENIAAKLNCSIEYVSPPNNSKWGVLLPVNSTGLMGMLQRNEADVGFSSVGRTIDRNIYLRSSMPSILSQLTMTIPPKIPYTSLEKLFLPFSLHAWLLIAAGYSTIYGLYVVLFRAKHHPYLEHIPDIFYTIWTILMGGPGYDRALRNSTRIFVMSLLLNAFVVRNLYQSALFQYLKSNDVNAANLHTYEDINEAGLQYYMYQATLKYFEDNPDVNKTIRIITKENTNWDALMYNISQHVLQGVTPLPLESIYYYVKHHGHQGMVYVSVHTGISFFIAFHFPRMSALQKPFDHLIHQLQAGGFIVHWKGNYRNDPNTWMNYEQENVPTPLHLHQVSGGFYLWAFCMLVAIVVFTVELILSKVTRAKE